MLYPRLAVAVCAGLAVLAANQGAHACTNLLVTKGASADGSVIITYTCDGEFHPRLQYTPAADHPPDELMEITEWSGKVTGRIKQVPHTYAVVGWMNEHQLAIAESTFDGRAELENPDGLLSYFTLMRLALQRAKTAREAIQVMTDLVAEYGYRDTGESFSIGDTNEAWILELIGPGQGGKGAEWVAVRVPDGQISCHANKSRIGEFPLNDTENCLYSANVISFAVERGYYDPKSGEPFRFCEAYCPATPKNQRYSDTRVWSLLRRAAPSLNLPADYNRAVPGAKPYPLSVKPDKQLSVADVFALMRDHFEGTEIDLTQGPDAGPDGTPNRRRPITWKIDGVEYAWERPISTPQTAFSFVSQSRAGLPDPIGGVYWYGLDDTYLNCYVPLYCGITAVPESYAAGTLGKFSWDDAWWVFNFVANYTNLRYADMKTDIQAVQSKLEGQFLALQPAVEKTALELAKSDPQLLKQYLTDYSVSHAETVVKRYRELGEYLITKYNDGYVQDPKGRPHEQGYPESWLRDVLRQRAEQYKIPEKTNASPESRLID
jgi:dipeptidase